MSVTHGMIVEPSIAHSVFLPREFDPFCDTYVETITRMSRNELMNIPQLSDIEFLDQVTRGVDSVLGKEKISTIPARNGTGTGDRPIRSRLPVERSVTVDQPVRSCLTGLDRHRSSKIQTGSISDSSSVKYPAIWRCEHSFFGRCGCECGECASLEDMPRLPREMRYLLWEICSHL
jgi:hypothetical protein